MANGRVYVADRVADENLERILCFDAETGDELWKHATQPRFEWHHDWKNGDVLMWDNRCVMHRRDPFDPKVRRTLHRVVIKGTKPFRTPGALPAHERAAERV